MKKCCHTPEQLCRSRSDGMPSISFKLKFHLHGERDSGIRDACFLRISDKFSPHFLGSVLEPAKKPCKRTLKSSLLRRRKLQYELTCPSPVSDNRCTFSVKKDLLRTSCLVDNKKASVATFFCAKLWPLRSKLYLICQQLACFKRLLSSVSYLSICFTL